MFKKSNKNPGKLKVRSNNLEKPTSNMLNENNLAVNFCPLNKQ
jgi:hypothetical protein